MYTRLNRPQPVRWGRRVAAFAAVLIAVIGLRAAVAYATNAAVTATRDCTHLTVTVTNQWDYRLDGLFSSSVDYGFEFHLDPGQHVTHSADMTGHPEPIQLTAFATFSNGAVAHITYSPASRTVTPPAGCVPPSTAPPLVTVPPPPPPVYPTTPTTSSPAPGTSTTVPETPETTSPPVPVPASTGAAGHPTTIAHQLPVTGSGGEGAFLLAGLGCLLAGAILYTVRRRPS